jgi:polysaccharide biosynthesis transport protein
VTHESNALSRPTEFIGADTSNRTFSHHITLREFATFLQVHKRLILGVAVLAMCLTATIVMQLTPMYTATSVVMLDQRDQASVQNQVQIISSVNLAKRVAEQLNLYNDASFLASPGGIAKLPWVQTAIGLLPFFRENRDIQNVSAEHRAVLVKLISGLSVSPVGLSSTIDISYRSDNQARAAAVANAYADAYVEDQLDSKFDATKKETQWLASRIGELSGQAQAADTAVQRYKAEHHITMPVSGMSVVDQQTRDINSQLVLAKADLAEKEANYSSLMALQRSGQAANAAQVLSSPLIATLRAQETDLDRQIANLNTRYLPSHPKVLDLQAQRANLEQKITEEVQRIVESMRSDLVAANAHVASLQNSLSQLEVQGAGQDESSVGLTALQSSATSARSMYEAFLARLTQTQDREGIQTPDARVLSFADVPSSPSFPKKLLSIGLAGPAGLLLGLILAIVIERFQNGFRYSGEVEEFLGHPVLSVVPEIPTKDDGGPSGIISRKPLSMFSESIRGIKLGIQLSNVDSPPQVVVITSSGPGEGKTTVAISLARVASSSGLRTVLVDCDMRLPAIRKTLAGDGIGLVEVLSGAGSLRQALVKDAESDAVILPCVQTPANPADLIGSKAMEQLVVTLRSSFDFIVIDAPPVLPVNDAKVIGRLADATLFVLRWERTPREAAVSAVRALTDAMVPICGVAMTRADNERFRQYSYGYGKYGNFAEYYTE